MLNKIFNIPSECNQAHLGSLQANILVALQFAVCVSIRASLQQQRACTSLYKLVLPYKEWRMVQSIIRYYIDYGTALKDSFYDK